MDLIQSLSNKSAMGIGFFCGLGIIAVECPIGLAGGAIYGASFAVIYLLTDMISLEASSILPVHLKDNIMFTAAKEVALLSISLFGGWQLASMLGVNMILEQAAALTAFSLMTGAVAHLFIPLALTATALIMHTIFWKSIRMI